MDYLNASIHNMNINNFDLNLLRAFDVLMQEQNVSNAAKRMHLSQPAMSNTLSRLRDLLDDPVLVRTSLGMQPTPKAKSLEKSIRTALQTIDQSLCAEPDFNPATSEQVFHIATTDYAELLLIPKLLNHLSQVAPGIRLEIHSLGPDIPEPELEKGAFDFALGRFTEVPKRLRSEFWLSEKLVCLVQNNHSFLRREISLEQFLTVPQIWVSGGQRTGVVDQWLKENKLKRNVTHSTPSFLIAPSVVAQTDMLVVTPLSVANHFTDKLPVKILPLPMKLAPFDLHILWHPFHAETPAHTWFREQLLLMR